jgi:hypothetical protein
MSNNSSFRVAVLGAPQTEQWLLAQAFAETRGRPSAYELAADAAARRPDLFVIDSENEHAIARWAALDPRGEVPAAFFVRVHPRAKCALVIPRPHTSGSVVDALDRLARRFLQVSDANALESRAGAGELALAAV